MEEHNIDKEKTIVEFTNVIENMYDAQEPTLKQVVETVREIWEFAEDRLLESPKVLEELSNLEHEQWMHFRKGLFDKLAKEGSIQGEEDEGFVFQMDADKFRVIMASKDYIPYSQLSEEVKEHDRKWARKVLEILKKEAGADSPPVSSPTPRSGVSTGADE